MRGGLRAGTLSVQMPVYSSGGGRQKRPELTLAQNFQPRFQLAQSRQVN
jgi:hypothetical protein